jgi:hypothetical protein
LTDGWVSSAADPRVSSSAEGWVSSIADPGQLGCRITAAQSNQQRAIDLLESQRGSVEDHYFERLHSYQRQEAWVDQNLFGMVADG